MPVQATTNGSPDVNSKDEIVMTPVSRANSQKPETASATWREIVQSGADSAQIEGFALEYLIDLQRNRMRPAGEGR
ncbi:hypothetical protein AN191_03325 [Loktanella sp. 5RATIMAR09]|uniref:hypothetical protein n=1 Tax=Loktanella sp. 5RATIMAR09 TaxID=1225655 RepID=UPI0006EB9D52|nr:hypothetical protein [Loktanella sp. 5RATIMAR09]KQI72955.1 hypothetical protein AN191_03325 [Loktanella sp. 5RATIMAR09]